MKENEKVVDSYPDIYLTTADACCICTKGRFTRRAAAKQTAMMKEELALTVEQLPEVEEINLKFAQSTEALREKHRGDREAMIASFRESEQQKEEALAQVLTEEQMIKLREKKEAMRSQGRRGRLGKN